MAWRGSTTRVTITIADPNRAACGETAFRRVQYFTWNSHQILYVHIRLTGNREARLSLHWHLVDNHKY